MKLYSIRGWNDLYENNRSRSVKSLAWVSIPNRHDGETFTNIMEHKDGPAIFSTFILLVEIASKCTPRGTLIRGDGTPHTARSLSAKCRMPAGILHLGLSYLEQNTDWLVVEEVSGRVPESRTVLPDSGSRVPDACEERTEGMEGRKGSDASLSPASFLNAVFVLWNSTADNLKLAKCLVVSDKRRRTLEARNRDPFFLANWETALGKLAKSNFCKGTNERGWVATFDWFIQPDSVAKIMEGKYDNRTTAHQPNNSQRPDRNAGTLNASRIGQYDNVGKVPEVRPP